MVDATKEAVPFRYYRAYAHTHLQRLSQHEQELYNLKSEDPWLRESNRHSIPSLTNNLHQVDICLKEKK